MLQALKNFEILEILGTLIDAPFLFLVHITCPAVSEEHYSRYWTMVTPIPASCLIWFCAHPVFDMTYVYYALPVGIVLTILLVIVLPWDGSYPRWGIILTIIGVVMGLSWSYIMIEVLIDVLDSVGIVLNLQ